MAAVVVVGPVRHVAAGPPRRLGRVLLVLGPSLTASYPAPPTTSSSGATVNRITAAIVGHLLRVQFQTRNSCRTLPAAAATTATAASSRRLVAGGCGCGSPRGEEGVRRGASSAAAATATGHTKRVQTVARGHLPPCTLRTLPLPLPLLLPGPLPPRSCHHEGRIRSGRLPS